MNQDRDRLSDSTPAVGKSSGKARNTLAELLPDADYEFPMRFQRGQVAEFFGPQGGSLNLLAERQRWLTQESERYAALLPEGAPLLDEMLDELRKYDLKLPQPILGGADRASQTLLATGQSLEPDFLLLKHGDDGPRLVAGCVCFPSSWSLAEKMGRPVEWIHDVVPGLNQQLGARIGTFLRRMAPGIAWQRANWGLSRSSELNQHPERKLPRLDATVTEDDVWLRVEEQALVALPRTQGVLFGIRIAVYPLAQVKEAPAALAGLRRALQTMSDEMAGYKNLATARETIIRLLSERSGD